MHVSAKKISWLLTAAAFGAMLLHLVCTPSTTPQTQTYLNHHDTVNYVGMQTCRGCHSEIYNSFIQTGMGQSFGLATRSKSAADFSKKHVVYDASIDMHYAPFWKNDTLYITEFRLSGKDTVHKRIEKVDYIIGSGQHTNSHLMERNGYIYQLPLTWYAQKQKWDLPPGFENGKNARFTRSIGFECMSCHNALPEFETNSGNKFTSIPLGIDCERCHGPGEVHVAQKAAGIIVDTATQIDYSIVNPKKLPWNLQIDVCQRCHLQGNAVLKPGKTFTDFRPGMQLSSVVDIYMPKYQGKEDEFIMASHAQRLQLSKCFVASKGGTANQQSLTCITCHNPHVSVKVTGTQVFNKACINCHQNQQSCTEKESVRLAKQDNCWGCHMPKSGTIDIPHVTVTDHWIRVPAAAKQQEKIKTFIGLYCINNAESDLLTKSKAYINDVEKFEGRFGNLDTSQQIINSLTLSKDEYIELQTHIWYLQHNDAAMVKLGQQCKPTQVQQPWTCYRIGQSYQNLGLAQAALAWYQQAVNLAPSNLDFINKLGTILIQLDETAKGIDCLKRSLNLYPQQPDALTNIGFGYLKQNNAAAAMNAYNQALTIDPDYEQALLNKAALLNLQGNPTEAKKVLKQLLKRNPKHPQVNQLLQQL